MAKKMSKFRGAVSANSQKQKTQGASYGHLRLPRGVSVFKEEPGGRAHLDIMPYLVTDAAHPDYDSQSGIAAVGELWYKRPYKLHRNIGSQNDSLVCPTSVGKRCPICEHRAKRIKEGAPEEETKELKPSLRNLYCVIPLGMDKYEETYHIWDISQYLFQDMLNDEIHDNEDFEVFPDLEEGLSLRLRFSEEVFGKNKYAKISRIDFEEREGAYDEAILKDIPLLDEVLIIPSYKEAEAKFFELDDNADDSAPPKMQRAPKPTPTVPANDDDDDKPRQRKTVKKPAAPVEEPVTEEEDDTPPSPRARTPRRAAEPEPEPEAKAPARKAPGTPTPAGAASRKSKSTDTCPFGHTFGDDCEQFDECDDCEKWDSCMSLKEASM